ncbi:5-formyltetrahydrofolate cyclo-ligase [Paracoccus caeni]|uniref:5-formyltetrahydrofolate cyclo-ligase n=1 Tax=Paracoccus caeni TaxID=657651 RepID=A0A934SD17_9RHOB|nr:5-formyltetrahydrofolate cyclo-ligase [Paracoccus caeni]MBK4215094.1 5-formyltetrahydrofolate cyclo-ligase [Paracoccus caeni]
MSAAEKKALRAEAMAARQQGGDQQALTALLIEALRPYRGKVLAGYWPMRGEADPLPAIKAHDGPICLPVVLAKATPLIFREWDGGALHPGAYGTSQPAESARVLVPDVLIVPLAGFDRAGNRLGYGGGFYDRTLQLLRESGQVHAIGLAFAAQELPLIPAEPFDQPLDRIVTDRGVLEISH